MEHQPSSSGSVSVPPTPISVTWSIPGKLYAVGGYDGASRQCLSTVEQYNPATNEWIYVADMSARRSGAGTYVRALGHRRAWGWGGVCVGYRLRLKTNH